MEVEAVSSFYNHADNTELNLFQRSDGGGVFQAIDLLNGRLLCGCKDVKACVVRSASSIDADMFVDIVTMTQVDHSILSICSKGLVYYVLHKSRRDRGFD
jgi:hypothetical protein